MDGEQLPGDRYPVGVSGSIGDKVDNEERSPLHAVRGASLFQAVFSTLDII